MVYVQKTNLKYRSIGGTTVLKGSLNLYSWILAAVLTIIGLSFCLIAFSLDNLYSLHNDFEPLDPTIFLPWSRNKTAEDPRYSPERAMNYLQASHLLKNKPDVPDFHYLPTSHSMMTVDNYKLFCYYSLPSNDTDGLLPSQLDATLCTHILLAFAQVSENFTLVHLQPEHQKFYNQVLNLKKENPLLKVIISVTDGDTGNFAKAVSTRANRIAFCESILEFLIEHRLDGVDLDWEFPGWPGAHKKEEKRLFKKLLQQLQYSLSGNFLITLAAAAPSPIIDKAYDLPFIARLVDFISIMGYDYHSYVWYLPVLGPNAPLFSSEMDQGYFKTLNGNWSVNYYLYKGVPANKLIMGMPTYGHSFTLVNPDSTDYGMPAADIGRIGNLGFVDYADIVAFLRDPDTIQIFDRATRVPYAYKGDQWISFDNEQSLAYKAAYLMAKGLAGAMVWSLNTDDYAGKYHKTNYPLVRRIKNVLKDDFL